MSVKDSSPLGVGSVGSLIASSKIDFVIRAVEVGGKNLAFYEVLTPFADIKIDKTPTTPTSSEDRERSIADLKKHSLAVKRSILPTGRLTLFQASSHAHRLRGTDASLGRYRVKVSDEAQGMAYRTFTVVANLMSFEELPIISFTGSASTLN